MLKSLLIASAAAWSFSGAASAAPPPTAPAASPADEATSFVTTIIDKFNRGDIKGWVSAQEDNTYIVDDFGPHVWSGPASAQRWLDDYVKMAKTQGVTAGRVDYGKAIATDADQNNAYIVLPTTYSFMQNGAKMASTGSMTFVMKRHGKDWKIASWTYSGGTAAPEK
jgi:hypothetical protein